MHEVKIIAITAFRIGKETHIESFVHLLFTEVTIKPNTKI